MDDYSEIALEIEALEATYSESLIDISVNESNAASISFNCTPRDTETDRERFCAAVLHLSTLPDYPSSPPAVSLEQCKGKLYAYHFPFSFVYISIEN